jgi:hypothetical protein
MVGHGRWCAQKTLDTVLVATYDFSRMSSRASCNSRLVRYREELNLLSPYALSRLLKIAPATYLKYERMELSPLETKTGQWRKSARLVAEFHGVDPSELWPRTALQMRRSIAIKSLHEDPFPSAEDACVERELEYEVSLAIRGLALCGRIVIYRRFGFDEHGGRTFQMIGKRTDRSAEAVRATEQKALRELRHPRISQRLKYFVDDRWMG